MFAQNSGRDVFEYESLSGRTFHSSLPVAGLYAIVSTAPVEINCCRPANSIRSGVQNALRNSSPRSP